MNSNLLFIIFNKNDIFLPSANYIVHNNNLGISIMCATKSTILAFINYKSGNVIVTILLNYYERSENYLILTELINNILYFC